MTSVLPEPLTHSMSNYERIPARHQHLRVGCAAKAKSLVVVTHNRKHFEHIEGLEIEDWA